MKISFYWSVVFCITGCFICFFHPPLFAWQTNGVAICTVVYNQDYPTIVSDRLGGAMITWWDHRSGTDDIYTQRIDGNK